MHTALLSDFSLYELAIQSDPPPVVSQLSPATFKSAVSVLIDRLIASQIEAIVWAKLPKGESWQAEIDRYSGLSGVPKAVYNFRTSKEDAPEESSVAEERPHDAAPHDTAPHDTAPHDTAPHDTARTPSALPCGALNSDSEVVPLNVVPLNVESSGLFRREYFLLVWSVQFQGVILAHRPRAAKIRAGGDAQAGENGNENGNERKQLLLTLVSFDGSLVTQLLQGIETAVGQGPGVPTAIAERATLIAQWQRQITELRSELSDLPAPSHSNINALGNLLTQQLQKQDDLWQRYSVARKQGEAAALLERQNEALVHSVRLKDDFLSNVGQELRTPLTTIKTALTLLNSPNLKPSQRQRYMELIAKECDRQSCLITSLLDLVQLDQTAEQTAVESIKLCETVPGFVSTYQPLAKEKGIMMAYTIPEDLPAVSCTKTWLRQIVTNLLHNGIKFTLDGGEVWVKAKQQGDYVQLEFRDTGCGIAPSEIPKIFDRFYRIRQSGTESRVTESPGAGLGLTIVQQLLLYCGGSISVKSRLGEGSIFNVLLPIHRPL